MARLKNNIPYLKDFLDEKSSKYESPSFIKDDPILIPHRFTNTNDIEVSIKCRIGLGKNFNYDFFSEFIDSI